MKKTEFITFRTDRLTKAALTDIAIKRKWSISLLVEEIIKEFVDRNATSEDGDSVRCGMSEREKGKMHYERLE